MIHTWKNLTPLEKFKQERNLTFPLSTERGQESLSYKKISLRGEANLLPQHDVQEPHKQACKPILPPHHQRPVLFPAR